MMAKKIIFGRILWGLTFCLAAASRVSAQPVTNKVEPVQRGRSSAIVAERGRLGLNDHLGPPSAWEILGEEGDPLKYDSLTLVTLRNLAQDSSPFWSGDTDNESGRTDRATQRAFVIQGGRHMSALINGSDLRHTFRGLKETMSSIQNYVRFSLQSSPSGLKVSKKREGEKLLELNLDFNLKTGLDPQFRIGTNWRIRYDFVNQTPILEFGKRF